MAYDEELALRLHAQLETVDGVISKRMFGGMAFLANGHMFIAASSKGNLMVRIAPEDHDDALGRPHVSPMHMGGRETKGWIRVDEPGYESDDDLTAWVDQARAYAETLPPK
jgi:TfoX/Sxy family transcriptional regulator of competence genes